MKKKILIISCIGLIFIFCVTSIILIFLAIKNNWFDARDKDEDISEDNIEIEDYLGYELVDIEIENYEQASIEIEKFYENFEQLAHLDENLSSVSDNEDAEKFFENYKEYNETAGKLISQADALGRFFSDPQNDYEENDGAVGRINLIKVYAKERSSLFYYIPVFGSLVQGKHESIESIRWDIWNYLNSMPSVDRTAKLEEYGLKYTSDVKVGSDELIEELSKDPELNGSINWGKVSAELADNACIATAEGLAIGYLPGGVKTGAKYGAVKTGVLDYADWVQNQAHPKKTVVMISEDTKEFVNKILKEIEEKEWKNLKEQTMKEIAEEVKKMEREVVVIQQKEKLNYENYFELFEGLWDGLVSYTDVVPFEIFDIEVKEDQIVEIKAEPFGYGVDPEIAKYLGFNAEISYEKHEISDNSNNNEDNDNDDKPNYCEMENIEDQWIEDEVMDCVEAFESCNSNPYYYAEGYSKCISAGGGCWDIPRWNWLENPEACNDWQNRYTGQDLADATQYCTCIDNCKAEFQMMKDCEGEYQNCCDKIE